MLWWCLWSNRLFLLSVVFSDLAICILLSIVGGLVFLVSFLVDHELLFMVLLTVFESLDKVAFGSRIKWLKGNENAENRFRENSFSASFLPTYDPKEAWEKFGKQNMISEYYVNVVLVLTTKIDNKKLKRWIQNFKFSFHLLLSVMRGKLYQS